MDNDKLDEMIINIFNKRKNENPFRKKIDDLIINLDKKRKKRNRILYSISAFLLTSTTVFAIGFSTFNLSNVGIDDSAIELATHNGYIQTVENDFQIYNDLGIKVNSFLMDDINLIISFDFKIDNLKIEDIKNISISDFTILDEKNNIIYSDNNSSGSLTKSIGFNKVKKTSNNTFTDTFFAMSENYPNSNKLYIEFNNVLFNCKKENININGIWKFEIDVPNKMINSEELLFNCNQNKTVGDITVGSIKVTNSGSLIEISSNSEESINKAKIKIKVDGKEYKITNNMFDIISQDGSDKITRFIYCNLTKYEKIDKILVEIKDKNKKQEFIFEKKV